MLINENNKLIILRRLRIDKSNILFYKTKICIEELLLKVSIKINFECAS